MSAPDYRLICLGCGGLHRRLHGNVWCTDCLTTRKPADLCKCTANHQVRSCGLIIRQAAGVEARP